MAPQKSRSEKATPTRATKGTASDVPGLFRIHVEVGNLEEAVEFDSILSGITGRKHAGSRCYFTCGPVTLQVVDVSSVRHPHAAAKALCFMVKDVDEVFVRAQALGCLDQDDVHYAPGNAISVRPWGERPLYLKDKWANHCVLSKLERSSQAEVSLELSRSHPLKEGRARAQRL